MRNNCSQQQGMQPTSQGLRLLWIGTSHHHRKHVECQPSRMKKDEQAVQDLLESMNDFDADPFDMSSPTLRSLQSGRVASPELVHDLKTALLDGKAQVETLLQERIFTKTKPLTATSTRIRVRIS